MDTRETHAKLSTLFGSLGAELGSLRGYEAPLSFGSVEAEHAALRQGCGLVTRPWFSWFTLSGEDRQRYLNGLVTSDVKSLEAGQGAYGFVTEAKGHVMADILALATSDGLFLRLPPGMDEQISGHLLKYVIIDRVELRQEEGLFALSLVGPQAKEAVTALLAGAPPEQDWTHREAVVADLACRVIAEPFGRSMGWTFLVEADSAPELFQALAAQGGAEAVGGEAWERLRVEEGRPIFGIDYGPKNFPQETTLEDAVSYTKGCYLGQEIVARIHYRGGVNRQLCGLRLADAGGAQGREVRKEGRAVGQVTSNHGALALAILHKKAWEAGTQVEIDGMGPAEVVALPFSDR